MPAAWTRAHRGRAVRRATTSTRSADGWIRADDERPILEVRPEDRERIRVSRGAEGSEGGWGVHDQIMTLCVGQDRIDIGGDQSGQVVQRTVEGEHFAEAGAR